MENYINVKNRKLYFEKNFRSFLIDSIYIQIFLLKKILIYESYKIYFLIIIYF